MFIFYFYLVFHLFYSVCGAPVTQFPPVFMKILSSLPFTAAFLFFPASHLSLRLGMPQNLRDYKPQMNCLNTSLSLWATHCSHSEHQFVCIVSKKEEEKQRGPAEILPNPFKFWVRRRGSRPRLSHDSKTPEEAPFNPAGLVLMPALALVKGENVLAHWVNRDSDPLCWPSTQKWIMGEAGEGGQRGRSEASSRTLIGLDVCPVRFPGRPSPAFAVHYQTKYTSLESP